ncbi:MAG TPA: MFS transporter [Burkholderiales bacterium]
MNNIFFARALRDFGDGFVAILLPVYLTALGLSAFDVGVIATAALLGSALLTLGAGFLAVRYDVRVLLLAASVLMIASGLAYAAANDYAVLLVVAFVGTINPSGGSTSVFVPLEHTVLSGAVAPARRTWAFARYSLIGALAGAAGALVAATPDWLAPLGIGTIGAIKIMFGFYAVLGLIGGFAYFGIARRKREESTSALGPSRGIVYKLAALFAIDSFAGGFVVHSLLALWLFQRFDLSLAAAGAFFFWSGVLSAFSFPVAAWIGSRIGLINTMVYTHIPSSLCLIAAAFAPSVQWALGLLLVRAALSQMDVPTRSSYVMAVVTEAERPAAASVTAVPRSLASAISPALAGALFSAGYQAWPLLLCGGLKILYDLLLLVAFRTIKPPEEQRA